MSATKEKRCLIYARQSSGKEKESESILMQLHNCRQLAQQKGLQILGEFHDHNSSGRLYPTGAEELEKHDGVFHAWHRCQTSDKRYRSGLGALLKKLPQVKYVIVDDLTRLARPLSGSYLNDYLKQLFQQSGVMILTVKNGSMDYGNYMDCLVSDVQTHIVDNQLKIQTQKARAAILELKKNGYYPTSPKMFGIEYIGGKKRAVKVNSACAEVIRFINHEIRDHKSVNVVTREVNERYRHLFKKVCYPSTVRHIATHPFYAGYMYDPDGVLIEAQQMKGKTILTLQEWQEARSILSESHQDAVRHGDHKYPFSGLLYCGNCGARLVAGNDHGKIYYYCRMGTNILRNEQCRHSRLNVTLRRKNGEYQGLQDAVLPLLLLSRFREEEEAETEKTQAAELDQLRIKLRQQEEKLDAMAGTLMQSDLPQGEQLRILNHLSNAVRDMKVELAEKQIRQLCKDVIQNRKPLTSRRIRRKQLTAEEYSLYLRKSIKRITSYYDHISIQTCFGTLELQRTLSSGNRNFPDYTLRVSGDEQEMPLSCNYQLTYFYPPPSTARKPLLDFAHFNIDTRARA